MKKSDYLSHRFDCMPKTTRLEGINVLVTGVGYRPVKTVFASMVDYSGTNQPCFPSHDKIVVGGEEMKLNIGAATALIAGMNGANVHMVSNSPEKLEHMKCLFTAYIGKPLFQSYAKDVTRKEDLVSLTEEMNKLPIDQNLYWVQSVGLGAGSVHLRNPTPYGVIAPTSRYRFERGLDPIDVLDETKVGLQSLIDLYQLLVPRFLAQNKTKPRTKVCVITSMSAIRTYVGGAGHCAAKAAVDMFAKSATIEQYKDRIYVSVVRPGGTDTGLYDGQEVQDSLIAAREEFGCNLPLFLAPPSSTAELVCASLMNEGHVLSMNMVAEGQFPHGG